MALRGKQRTASAAQPAQSATVAEKRRIAYRQALAAFAQPAQDQGINPYVLPKPLPGVVPDGAQTMGQDYGITGPYEFAASYASGSFGEGIVWPGYPLLAEMAQRPEYRKISETIAKEMTRKWIKIQASGDDDKSDKIAQLEAAFDRYRIQDLFRKATELDGFFGRGQIFIDVGADDEELAAPLFMNPNKIKKKGLKGFTVIEPIWSYPTKYNSRFPLKADFYKPQAWFVMGQEVHISRFLTFVGREVPDILKPAYYFGGLSMSQMAKPYIDNWLRTRQSVSDLLHSFSVSGIKTSLASTIMGGGGEEMVLRAQLFNQSRDNRGLFMLDKESEEFFNVSTPLGTLDHLQAQAQEQMASVAGIPLVKLLGITPSGLNASSDGEIRSFYDSIESYQQHLYNANLEKVLELIQLSEFGVVDPEIGFRFEPLWQLDETARAAIRKTDIDSAIELINAGVLHPVEERKRLATTEDSLYNGIDVDDVPEPMDALDPDTGEPGEAKILPDPAAGQKHVDGV